MSYHCIAHFHPCFFFIHFFLSWHPFVRIAWILNYFSCLHCIFCHVVMFHFFFYYRKKVNYVCVTRNAALCSVYFYFITFEFNMRQMRLNILKNENHLNSKNHNSTDSSWCGFCSEGHFRFSSPLSHCRSIFFPEMFIYMLNLNGAYVCVVSICGSIVELFDENE